MTLLAVWKVLEEIVIDFRKKELPIPQKIMDDLRSAKIMINVIDSDENGCMETEPKITEYLGNVEAYLISEAPKNFSSETIDNWLDQIEKATNKATKEEDRTEPRFIRGLIRNQKWLRVKPLASLQLEKLESLALESKLSFMVEEDGQLLVYGKDNAVKEFVRKMTTLTSRL